MYYFQFLQIYFIYIFANPKLKKSEKYKNYIAISGRICYNIICVFISDRTMKTADVEGLYRYYEDKIPQ